MEYRNRFEDESLDDYVYYLYGKKAELEKTSDELAAIINEQFNLSHGESCYRKRYAAMTRGNSAASNMDYEYIERQKQIVKLRDQRNAYNAIIREQARVDDFRERLLEEISKVEPIKFESIHNCDHNNNGGTLVAVLSDVHMGLEFNYLGNRYDTQIAIDRLNEYANKIKDAQELYQAENLVVVCVGDMIHGEISASVKASCREGTTKQIKIVSEAIAQLIAFVADDFVEVNVYSVAGNHSRMNPDKKQADLGSYLDDLIPWWLQQRLRHFDNVSVYDTSDNAITDFYIGDSYCVGVHGNFDNFSSEASIGKLERMTNKPIQFVFTGHLHHTVFNDQGCVGVIQGGSLCGSGDQYTRQRRLTGKSSQTMAYFDSVGNLKAIIPIYFD